MHFAIFQTSNPHRIMRNTSSYSIFLIVFSVFCLIVSQAKQNEGYDLDPNADIRIGIKRRVKGCTRRASAGDKLFVHYVGTLYKDGKQFDSSYEREDSFEFRLGKMQVIPGWDMGMRGMCVGEIRKLTIPSELAYGEVGAPPHIHPGATLVFDVELIDILPQGSLYDAEDDGSYYERAHFEDF